MEDMRFGNQIMLRWRENLGIGGKRSVRIIFTLREKSERNDRLTFFEKWILSLNLDNCTITNQPQQHQHSFTPFEPSPSQETRIVCCR